MFRTQEHKYAVEIFHLKKCVYIGAKILYLCQ
nr:MAG TPA: hypothetical protein [Caudoviricetes sp.]